MFGKALAGVVPILMLAALVAGCQRAAPREPGMPAVPRDTGIAVPDTANAAIPRPDHVVVVIEENRGFDQIVGKSDAPYSNQLARDGALLTDAHGVAHPSQPNYLALFSGSTQGLVDDSCPHALDGANLATALRQKGLSFGGYSESMPATGFTGCQSGPYRRKHNPWVNFTNLDAAVNLPFTSFPTDFSRLPTVSFVVPDQNNDMHDGPVSRADQWLREHLDSYVQWAKAHNSLLILTWDEDDNTRENRIPVIFVGARVKPGTYGGRVDHYSVLRTIETMYGLPAGGRGQPITGIWQQ